MQNDKSEDGTVIFLPNRLNCQPVVVRGLTADELWISVGVTGAAGLVLGMVLAVLTGQIGMVPTTILLCIAAGIFVGGGMIRRQKRGRPPIWLYRQIQWQVRCRYPGLAHFIGAAGLINRTGGWEVRRELTRRESHEPL
jgi:conjugative transfer region protein (TIGR03750 family)